VGATESVEFISLIMNEPNSIPEYTVTPLMITSLEDLRSKNYSLNYKQYLPQSAVEVDGFEMVKLGSIAKKLTTRGKHSAKDTIENGKYSLFSSSINEIYKLDTFDYTETCCIINSTNASGNAIINLGKNFSVTSDTFVFKCENDVTTIYIQLYLSTNIHLVKETFQGANHKHPTWDRLSEIQIPLPSLEKQQEIVEQIDFYTQMAHTEEQSLKLLEKIVMGWVKEMGRGKELVKLGEVCDIKYGDKNTTYDTTELYPGIGGGVAPSSYVPRWNIDAYTLIVSRSGSAGHVSRYPTRASAGSFAFVCLTKKERVLDDYLYFVVKHTEEYIKTLPEGTVQQNLNRDVLRSVEIPLPSLAEQQTLQSDFDEIRHKHAKIAEYKAKAQEAIQRLIPGTKKEIEKVEANQIIVPITMSHTSTCEVEEDGSGCTCRLPLTDEDDEKEDMPAVAAVAAVTPKKMKRPTIAK